MELNQQKISLTLIEDRIVLIEYASEDISLQEICVLYDELEKIGGGNKIGILNIFKEVVNHRNEDVMSFANTDPRPKKMLFASAIVIESIGMRLVMMLFMKFYNQIVHRKVFSHRTKALEWLREMRDK